MRTGIDEWHVKVRALAEALGRWMLTPIVGTSISQLTAHHSTAQHSRGAEHAAHLVLDVLRAGPAQHAVQLGHERVALGGQVSHAAGAGKEDAGRNTLVQL